MQCKCGYNFARESLKALQKKKKRPFKSYAVIDDGEYKQFIKAEIKIYVPSKSGKPKKKLRAISEASQYVRTMCECPDCGRLVIASKDTDSIEYYKRSR